MVDAVLSSADHGRLITFLSHIVGKQDAEDVAQDTYLRAYSHRESFSGRSAFRTWVFQIAKHAAFDSLRLAKRRPYGYAEPLIDVDFEQTEDMRRVRFELASELRCMPKAEALIMLTYMREGSCKDASRALGMPTNTLKTRIHRTRKRWLRSSSRRES